MHTLHAHSSKNDIPTPVQEQHCVHLPNHGGTSPLAPDVLKHVQKQWQYKLDSHTRQGRNG